MSGGTLFLKATSDIRRSPCLKVVRPGIAVEEGDMPPGGLFTLFLIVIALVLCVSALRVCLRLYHWRRAHDRLETGAWRRVVNGIRNT